MFLLLFVRYKKGQIFSLCKKKKKKDTERTRVYAGALCMVKSHNFQLLSSPS